MAMQTRQKQASSPNSNPKKTFQTRNRNNNDPLTSEEVELLLSKVDNLMEHTLLLFGFTAGVRVSETAFDHTAINQVEGYVQIWDQKKRKSRRIWLQDSVIMALQRYWNEKQDKKSPKLFDISSKTIERIIQRWTYQVLGKKKSWHCVRHTYITLSFERQIPISVVIENTGDAPSTILRYYTKLSPTFIKQEINTKPLFKVI